MATDTVIWGWRYPVAAASVITIVFCLAISVLVVYQGRVEFSIPGIDFRSSELFRPFAFAFLAYLALGLLVRRVRPDGAVLAILMCLLAYSFHFDTVASGDVIPAEYTALSMVSGRGTSLVSYPELLARGLPYYLVETPHGLRSSFPLGPSLLAWPLFLPAPFLDTERPELLDRIGRLAALLVAVVSVYLVYRIAARLDPPFSPSWIALAYGLGTSHWMTSASALWQHGPGEMWVLGAIERLLDTGTPVARRLLAAGAAISLAVFSRPALVVSAFLFFMVAAWIHRRRAALAGIGAAALALPLLYDHLADYGTMLGAYGAQTHAVALRPLEVWSRNVVLLLGSPSRGVIWFEPVVAFTLGLALLTLFRRRSATLLAGISGFALFLVLYANHSPWWGGHCIGPRYLTDALPLWILAVCSLGPASKGFRAIALGLTVVGVAVNITGTTRWAGYWNTNPDVDDNPSRLETFDDSQLLFQFLSFLPGGRHLRDAVEAENLGAHAKALASWEIEQARRPWNRLAARRVVDLLIRNDRLDEAEDEVSRMASLWPNDPYFAQLCLRVPSLKNRLNDTRWLKPTWVRASRNPDLADRAIDGSLGTSWSTVWLQRSDDWLELGSDPGTPTKGVALFYAPAFGEGPSSLFVEGVTPEGNRIALAAILKVTAPRKGWVVVRYLETRLAAVRLSLLWYAPRRFTVFEARLLSASPSRQAPSRASLPAE